MEAGLVSKASTSDLTALSDAFAIVQTAVNNDTSGLAFTYALAVSTANDVDNQTSGLAVTYDKVIAVESAL